MRDPLAGYMDSRHPYDHDEVLTGKATAGYRHVELSAALGSTERIDLDTLPAETRRQLEGCRLQAVNLSAHSDLTTADGLSHGVKGACWAAGAVVAMEIHGDLIASKEVTTRLRENVAQDSIRVNYDTANVETYSGDMAVDDLRTITSYPAHIHLAGFAFSVAVGTGLRFTEYEHAFWEECTEVARRGKNDWGLLDVAPVREANVS